MKTTLDAKTRQMCPRTLKRAAAYALREARRIESLGGRSNLNAAAHIYCLVRDAERLAREIERKAQP